MQSYSRSFRKPSERLNSNIASVLRSLIAHMTGASSSSELAQKITIRDTFREDRSRSVDGSCSLPYSCAAVVLHK
jgi:hypothetical protein